ncbi:unnamed protein product [marine sediment metagenome]|uniref:Peptidase S9 prolyl oligopeptidase catalytic domain-containing protein n=3 Tax=marine sediment metagenome TaxID=412755 RepID=X0Z6C0_9ZZZZ
MIKTTNNKINLKHKNKIIPIVTYIFIIFLSITLFNGCTIYDTFLTVYREIDEENTSTIEDVKIQQGDFEGTEIREEEVFITSLNGEKIYTHLHIPIKANINNKLPALILVQDTFEGSQEFDNPNLIFNANNLAKNDLIVLHFDPEGTGKSSGETDLGGLKSHDDLIAIINFIKQQPEVDESEISILTFGTGITTATGALARYPKIFIKYLIDIEGSVDRYDPNNPLALEYLPEDENFWKEREAINFIDAISCNYIRFQADNNQAENEGYFSYLIRYMNKATEGYPIHTQLNFAPPDTLFIEIIEIQPEEGSEDILNHLLKGEINNYYPKILNRVIEILKEGVITE